MNQCPQPINLELDYNEQLRQKNNVETWLAETLEGSMRTPFSYYYDRGELYAEDGGAIGEMFERSLSEAKLLVTSCPDLGFEYRRRVHERDEYRDMLAMARGEAPNTMVVVSDFPPELMSAREDIGGYNVSRKQTMLRIIAWNGQELTMHTQTLDGSDRQGLEAIYDTLGFTAQPGELLGQRMQIDVAVDEQPYVVDKITGVYDRSLTQNRGGQWYAGRPSSHKQNTYDFVRCNQDIVQLAVEYYQAGRYEAPELYDIAATIKKRFNDVCGGKGVSARYSLPKSGVDLDYLWHEIASSGADSRAAGDVFSGCGASMSAKDQLNESGFGNKTDDCEFVSRSCPKCGVKNVKTIVTKTHISGSCGCTVKK